MMLISCCVWGRTDLGRNIEVEDIGDAFTILILYLIHYFYLWLQDICLKLLGTNVYICYKNTLDRNKIFKTKSSALPYKMAITTSLEMQCSVPDLSQSQASGLLWHLHELSSAKDIIVEFYWSVSWWNE